MYGLGGCGHLSTPRATGAKQPFFSKVLKLEGPIDAAVGPGIPADQSAGSSKIELDSALSCLILPHIVIISTSTTIDKRLHAGVP